ncbi:MAG TPA: ABC transporter substrate-binding protein [Candidatus Saccharimonadales bacterium]|nr:ABC transporter substrate-binding protein [Candidatus Saccharimonadales bacterium]
MIKLTLLLVRMAVLIFVAPAILGFVAAPARAGESGKPTHLRLAYSAITVNQAIPWIAHDAGHFKKHGLDVELIHASSILALQALLAGEVAVAQSVTDACVSSNLSGADTLFLGAILDKPLYSFIVNSKIKTPADLKGKRVGVTRVGSTPDALARAMLKMWNLDPVTDVTIVQLNEMGLLVQGLVNGVIDAAPISLPSNIRAKNLGYTELFDMTKIGKTYITGTVVTRKRFIDGQRDTAKRFMRGFLEGMKTYWEDEAFSIKVIQKWTRAKNRDEVKEAYDMQAKNMLRIPLTSIDGVRTILEGMEKLPGAKTADPRRFIDFTILDELEKEGFLKTLYKN